jgi:drug/metabolite transporter (DMT)-like permease
MSRFIQNVPPTMLLILTACLWSLGGLFIKQVHLHPLTVAGLRSFFAAIFLFFVFRPGWPRVSQLYKSFNLFTAIICYAGTVICFSIATKWTTAANAILLQSTAPLFVAPLAFVYLKEKIHRIDYFCGVGILTGLYFFFKGNLSGEFNRGDLFGIIAGVFFAFFIVTTRKEGTRGSQSAVFWGNILAALSCLPTLIPRQNQDSIWNTFSANAVHGSSLQLDNSFFAHFPTNQEWIFLAILGFVQLGIPYYLYSQAISRIPALKANLILLIEPVLNPLWVFVFLAEQPSINAIMGGSIVLASAVARSYLKK